jgi:hypothetical protein
MGAGICPDAINVSYVLSQQVSADEIVTSVQVSHTANTAEPFFAFPLCKQYSLQRAWGADVEAPAAGS